jgi:hypothetical protein
MKNSWMAQWKIKGEDQYASKRLESCDQNLDDHIAGHKPKRPRTSPLAGKNGVTRQGG